MEKTFFTLTQIFSVTVINRELRQDTSDGGSTKHIEVKNFCVARGKSFGNLCGSLMVA